MESARPPRHWRRAAAAPGPASLAYCSTYSLRSADRGVENDNGYNNELPRRAAGPPRRPSGAAHEVSVNGTNTVCEGECEGARAPVQGHPSVSAFLGSIPIRPLNPIHFWYVHPPLRVSRSRSGRRSRPLKPSGSRAIAVGASRLQSVPGRVTSSAVPPEPLTAWHEERRRRPALTGSRAPQERRLAAPPPDRPARPPTVRRSEAPGTRVPPAEHTYDSVNQRDAALRPRRTVNSTTSYRIYI